MRLTKTVPSWASVFFVSGVVLLSSAARATAQQSVTLGTDVLFYGDNTEFHGPFREGETIFGAAGRLFASIGLNDRVTLTLGVYGNHRYGGDRFDRAAAIASLAIGGPRSTVVMGTLPAWRPREGSGPDRAGPHGLLPPIQRDNLAFERPYEAGLSWTWRLARAHQDAWLNWQRLNTERHRERFDAGLNGRASAAPHVALGYQLHVVHEGGQLFASGPVADSAAYAAGAIVERRLGPLEAASFEVWGVLARNVPDRQQPDRSLIGEGFFARMAGARAGWRGHVIVWRGSDFVKDEGDSNYFSIRLDGTRYRRTRDYSEAGLTRRFRPAPEVEIEASVRGHRIEGRYAYSFRIGATTDLKWRVK